MGKNKGAAPLGWTQRGLKPSRAFMFHGLAVTRTCPGRPRYRHVSFNATAETLMSLDRFGDGDFAAFRAKLASDPSALPAIASRLHEIASLEGHSYGAVRLACECLRVLGADVPLCRSEELRRAREEKNGVVPRSSFNL